MKAELSGKLPSVSLNNVDAASVLAGGFYDVLRDVTPAGYSGRLRDSVLIENAGEAVLVGYDESVETGGMPSLEQIPKRRRTVLRWVSVDELESVIAGALSTYSGAASVLLENWLIAEVNKSVIS
jgi:hypothetical protein